MFIAGTCRVSKKRSEYGQTLRYYPEAWHDVINNVICFTSNWSISYICNSIILCNRIYKRRYKKQCFVNNGHVTLKWRSKMKPALPEFGSSMNIIVILGEKVIFTHGSISIMFLYVLKDLCVKFDTFCKICTIKPIFDTIWLD